MVRIHYDLIRDRKYRFLEKGSRLVTIRLYYQSKNNVSYYNMKKSVLMPLPASDFDPTETAIPWQALVENKIDVIFTTPDGKSASCDPIMLTGIGLGPWSSLLSAGKLARAAYKNMSETSSFQSPLKWHDVNVKDYQGLILPGGHAKGMRDYLESNCLQSIVRAFFEANKPVGAICHGVLLAARSMLPSGKSVLYGRKTTALLAMQEYSAWALTALWMGNYYRTYTQTVESEVTSLLASKHDFIKGDWPLYRDNPQQPQRGFAVHDGNYVSARWPGDAHCFSNVFIAVLEKASISFC